VQTAIDELARTRTFFTSLGWFGRLMASLDSKAEVTVTHRADSISEAVLRYFGVIDQIREIAQFEGQVLTPQALLLSVLYDAQHASAHFRQGALAGIWSLEKKLFAFQRRALEKEITNLLVEDEDLRCRAILLPSAGLGNENDFYFYDAVAWMSSLEKRSVDYARLFDANGVLSQLKEKVPQMMNFLTKFPLRLLGMRDAHRLIGYYRSTGYRLRLWTNYVPP